MQQVAEAVIAPSDFATFVLPVNARALRTALMHDFVAEQENCTFSTDGMRSTRIWASRGSAGLGLPKEMPAGIASLLTGVTEGPATLLPLLMLVAAAAGVIIGAV